MNLLRRMAGTALGVGLAAGLLLSGLQAVWVLPLIQEAERQEAALLAERVPPGPTDPAAGAPDATDSATNPAGDSAGGDGVALSNRLLFTVLADVLAGVGFALLLVAGMVLHGRPAGPMRGLIWAAAGYTAFVLAPALGLPPELPGLVVAPLAERQWWWVGTVAATAAGLALLAFLPVRAKWLGLPLLVLPHLLGAPAPPLPPDPGPPAVLAGRFVAAVLVTNAAFWAVLGSGCGWLLGKVR